ncbi:MAG: CADD family putative folate metabolism protein [Alphaproteobacteria bacterium]
MSFSAQIKDAIRDLHLLSHPFYQAWTEGKLTQEQLQEYAVQYKPFVEAFPRFVSALHSNCESPAARAEILENLMDEEGKTGRSAPHPQLWRDFMDGLGAIDHAQYGDAALKTKETFLASCKASYEEGLCALYAYEYQTPAISKTKIEGLKKFYGLTDERCFEFFTVHEVADIYHSQTCEKLIDAIPADKQAAALQSARNAAQSLWNFLSEAYGDNKMAC